MSLAPSKYKDLHFAGKENWSVKMCFSLPLGLLVGSIHRRVNRVTRCSLLTGPTKTGHKIKHSLLVTIYLGDNLFGWQSIWVTIYLGDTLFVQENLYVSIVRYFLVLLSGMSLFDVILTCKCTMCLFVIIRYVFWYTCLHAVVDNNLWMLILKHSWINIKVWGYLHCQYLVSGSSSFKQHLVRAPTKKLNVNSALDLYINKKKTCDCICVINWYDRFCPWCVLPHDSRLAPPCHVMAVAKQQYTTDCTFGKHPILKWNENVKNNEMMVTVPFNCLHKHDDRHQTKFHSNVVMFANIRLSITGQYFSFNGPSI